MIHGTVGGAATWVGQEGAFDGAAAIAMPGFPTGEAINNRDQAVEFVAALIEHVPAPRVLVAHELGAALAIEVCASYPDRVAGLIISGLGLSGVIPHDADIDVALADNLSETQGETGTLLRRAMDVVSDENRERTADLARSLDVRRAAAVHQPTLVVAGSDDPVTPLADVAALADEFPTCQGAIIPGARHLPMADSNVAFNLLVAGFLARVEVDAAAAG